MAYKANKTSIVKGQVNNPKGKPLGTANRVHKLIKEAIVEAAESVGEDGKGKSGLVGFLRRLALDPDTVIAFAGLLGRVIPLQVVARHSMQDMPPDQATQEARRRGLPTRIFSSTMTVPTAPTIDNEPPTDAAH